MNFPNPPSLFKPDIHQWIYFGGLAIIASSLPNSVFFMSVGQFVIAGNWLIEGKYKEKISQFWSNKPAVILSSIFFIYLFSGFWSESTDAFLTELRKKVPILTLTFLVASSSAIARQKRVRILLLLFLASVVVTSLIGFVLYNPETAKSGREYSPFVSHIRFGMMVVMTIFTTPWLMWRLRADFKGFLVGNKTVTVLITVIVILWLLFYLILLQALSSFVFLGVCLIFSVFYLTKKYSVRWVLWSLSAVCFISIASLLAIILWFHSMIIAKEPVDLEKLPLYTPHGNFYFHDTTHKARENGHLVLVLIAEDELRSEWNRRSSIDYDHYDKLGQHLRFTLFRYMASKGLTKDLDGMQQLAPEDIEAVENGIANYLYLKWPGVLVRIHQTIWEIENYQDGQNLDKHSLAKRFEFWKASITAIRLKPLTGWGAGDLKTAMHYGFNTNKTILSPQYWHNPHNQYLLWAIIFGIPATCVILGLLIYIPLATRNLSLFPNVIFLIILFLSMISEDTLQTQAGLTFFIFFYLLFNFIMPKEKVIGDWESRS